jgi:hypothetical protein
MGTPQIVIAFSALLLSPATCAAALLFDFKPEPMGDFSFFEYGVNAGGNFPSFWNGSGARGNGDGDLPPELQQPGGLTVETPFVIAHDVPGKTLNTAGTTTFRDATLTFARFRVSSRLVPVTPELNMLTMRPDGQASFRLLSTDPDGEAGPIQQVLLLEGTFVEATILITHETDHSAIRAGAILSDSVTYTGGLIHDAATAAGLPTPLAGAFSISLGNLLIVGGQSGDGFLADATGQFSANIPEPAALCLLPALLLLPRRSNRA